MDLVSTRDAPSSVSISNFAEADFARAAKSKQPILNTLWVGKTLTYIELLSLLSAMQHGHKVKLYSYTPEELRGVPKGIEVLDASAVMSRDKLISYAECRNGVALGANLWRYHMLAMGLGVWCDLDLVFVKPLDTTQPYILGREF